MSIRVLRLVEARSVAAAIRARNSYSKYRGNKDFYYQRAKELRGATVVDLDVTALADAALAVASHRAELVERVAILSAALAMNRSTLQKALGVRRPGLLEEEFDLVIGPRAEFVRSRKGRVRRGPGIRIDQRFVRRFHSLQFSILFEMLDSPSSLASRLANGVHWLFESLLDPDIAAATVKTSISLESMLVFSSSEPLARTLSERSAFLLTMDPMHRRAIAAVMKRFYDARSKVVHGGTKKQKLSLPLLVAADRIAILLMTALTANATEWGTESAFQDWCECERWGVPSDIHRPFGMRYLRMIVDAGCPSS